MLRMSVNMRCTSLHCYQKPGITDFHNNTQELTYFPFMTAFEDFSGIAISVWIQT